MRLGPDAPQTEQAQPDLRLVPVAVATWLGTIAGLAWSSWVAIVAGCAAAILLILALSHRWVRGVTARGVHAWFAPVGTDVRRTILVAVACLLVGLTAGAMRAAPVRSGPVADLAADQAFVHVEGVLTSDPETRHSRDATRGLYITGNLRVEVITGRGHTFHTKTTARFVAGTDWSELLPGHRVKTAGRLSPITGIEPHSALLRVKDPVVVISPPSRASRATEPLREGLRTAAKNVHGDARGLVPALLVGDESLITQELRDDMTDSGLAHLTAVSGMNVTIVLVAVLALAKWLRVRGYALPAVGILAVVGFVILARPDPSVVRAAVMGVIAVGGLTVAGRRRSIPTLAATVSVLILVDPWLATSAGFALSVCATAGIVIFATRWQRHLWWLPAPLAIGISVPLAAQAATLPILVAISGQVSMVSVLANALVALAVPLVTVAAAIAAALAPVTTTGAGFVAWLAGWPARWIAGVAHWAADLPGSVKTWPGGAVGIATAVAVSIVIFVVAPRVLKRRALTAGVAVVAAVMLIFRPTPGWPPHGWVVTACDVGQGDGFVLPVADGAAVVVDAGREPELIKRCLDDLDIVHVPIVVLTHFDADHVMGLPGVLDGREVGKVLVSPVPEPAAGASSVGRWLQQAGVPFDVGAVGWRERVGDRLTLDIIWPSRRVTGDGSASNNASLVVRATIDGVTVLLSGDVEPPAQTVIEAAATDLAADVLTVPHHGSPNQHEPFLKAVDPIIGLVSVGENDYGHPNDDVIDGLRRNGATVARTDEQGAIAVVRLPNGQLGLAFR